MESQLACHRCGSMLARKDARKIVLRTGFGKVDVPSPRLWACSCAAKQGQPRRSVSPLCKAVHQRDAGIERDDRAHRREEASQHDTFPAVPLNETLAALPDRLVSRRYPPRAHFSP
jgi:hypothetical protein